MKKSPSLNVGGIMCLLILVYLTCRILLLDDILPFSIGSVQICMNHWITHWHILAVGLLPLYVGLVFFGAALCGLFFGSALQRWVAKFLQQKSD